MNYGIAIDDDFLRTLDKYKDRRIITAKNRSTVALQQKDVYVAEAVKRLDDLKSDYGIGVTAECRFYNASGDQIKVNFDYSWHGSFFKDSPAQTVENGQWTTFIHVHPSCSARGCSGAVVYRTAGDTDIFIGWLNPFNVAYDPVCWAESKEKDHWWKEASEHKMWDVLNDNAGSRKEDSGNGYKVTVDIGGSTTSSCVVVIEKV